MRTELLDELKSTVKNWWVSLLLGVLYVGLAIFMMFFPGDSLIALALVFSITMFATGFFEIIFAVSNKNVLDGWGWYLTGGIIDLILGLVLICLPIVSVAVIPFLVAFWFMFRGFSAIGVATDMSRYGWKNWGWYLAFGILAVICSFAIIFQPAVGALVAVYMAAFAFMFIGFFRIMLAFDLKKLKDHNDKLKERLHINK